MTRITTAMLAVWIVSQSLVLPLYAQGLTVGQGVFTDRDGGTHRWQITDAHSLRWDGQVYLPAGVWFTPQSLRVGATEADLQRDERLLDALAQTGISDVCVVPHDSAAVIPAERWQRLVDALETRNLRYGISLGEAGLPIAQGYVVAPASNRIANVAQSGVVIFRAPYADHALTFVVDTHDNSVLGVSRVSVGQGVGRLPLQLQEGVMAVIVAYPHRPLADAGGFVPDVWEGYDSWRDGVLQTLGKVRFGKGLRFFVDPIGRWTLPLEDEGIVPTSAMFRLGFEAFLSRKYQTIENLMSAWALSERDLESFADAARQLPLWRGQKGISQLLDLQTGNLRRVEASRCAYWRDLNQYRREVLQEASDRMATVLKRHVADVPVLLSWQRFHPVYVNTQNQPGTDGLLVVTGERGANLALKSMAPAMGQATECVRPSWLLSMLTHDIKQGYADSQSLYSEAETLAQAGSRGWFFRLNEGTADATVLQWLRAFQQSALARAEWQQPPRVLFFPISASGICEVKRLPGDVWWLPSVRQGGIVNVGQNYRAYQLSTLAGEQYVMWAVDRERATSFRLSEPRVFTAQLPDGTPVKISGKGRNFSMRLPNVPVVFTNSGVLFPVEAAEDAINELARLIKLAESRRTDVSTARFRWQQARDNLRAGQVYTAYLLASEALNEIIQRVAQYLWMEAETADESNFDEIVEQPWASGGKLVRLQNFNDPPARGYFLRYRFAVREEGNYTLWVACHTEGSSPLLWSVDDNAPQPAESNVSVGGYGEGFGWIRMGTVRLSPGFHTVELRVVNRAAEGAKPYVQWCDVVLLTAENIIPQGTVKPPVR
ncbi:MAG: hypothetical protein RMM08_05020 [Armatimonadota bacterium]|nr:hypothetical protein [bacterium]MDW8320701.1 hypothetical protein [Armatimonadota bacterium]